MKQHAAIDKQPHADLKSYDRILKWRKQITKGLLNLWLLFLSVTCMFPLLWILYSSFKTQQEFSLNIVSLPGQLHIANYVQAIRVTDMGTLLFNSTYISVIAVSFTLALSFITGYVLSRFQFRGRSFLYVMFLFGMLIPIHSMLIPIFVQFNTLDINNKWYTLLFPNIAFNLPIAIFLFENFIRTIPTELEEAAYMDGSSLAKTMAYIIFPICRPVMATSLVLSFLNIWNEFPFALVLISEKALRTVPVGLSNLTSQFSVNYPQMMAALIIAILPVVIVYLLANKLIIQGMAAGAVKS